MEHEQATATMAAERYLLGEMDGAERGDFEEHFFGCEACAADVRDEALIAGAIHSERGMPRANVVPMRRPSRVPWLAAAAAAGGMAILGYQNLALQQAARLAASASPSAPRITFEHAQSLAPESRGEDVKEIKASEWSEVSQDIVPPEPSPEYRLQIRDDAGAVMAEDTIPAQEKATVHIPPHSLKPGKYTFTIEGKSAGGKLSPVSTVPLEVRPN